MSSTNPYEAPQAALLDTPTTDELIAVNEPWLEPERSKLLRIARFHRGMTCFGSLLVAALVATILITKFGGEISLTGLIFLIGLGIATIICTCCLSLAIQAKERPLVVAFGMLIPPAAFMMLLQYSRKAARHLQAHGLKVGLLGVKRSSILKQLDDLKTRHDN